MSDQANEERAPVNTAVITLDFVNDICHPEGKISAVAPRVQSYQTIAKANRLLAWARQHGYLVCHVRVMFSDDYRECSGRSRLFTQVRKVGALKKGTWGTQFCDDLDVHESDAVITKHRVSGFYATDLQVLLSSHQIGRVILCGVSTPNAVELTAREGHDRDFNVVVAQDACEADSDENHDASLAFLKRIVSVQWVDDITHDEIVSRR